MKIKEELRDLNFDMDSLVGTIPELMEKLKELKEEVSKKGYDKDSITFEIYQKYEGDELEIYAERDETDKEKKIRIEAEKKKAERSEKARLAAARVKEEKIKKDKEDQEKELQKLAKKLGYKLQK